MYGTLVKILAILRSSCARNAISYQILNLLLEACICSNVLAINFFFHNLTCQRYEVFKYLVSYTQHNKCVAYGTLILWSFHPFHASGLFLYPLKNIRKKWFFSKRCVWNKLGCFQNPAVWIILHRPYRNYYWVQSASKFVLY